jgi:hypothetical protein
MRRRALLASLGALSTGCLGSGSSDPTAGRTETPRSTTDAETPEPNAEFELTDLAVSTRTDGPSVEYILEPSAFYSGDAVEREETRTGEERVVMAVSGISDASVREAVETAIADGEWRSNDLPDGVADLVERVDFFTGVRSDETYTHVGLELHRLDPDSPPAIEFDALAVDSFVSPGDPGVVELSLTNVSSEPRTVFSGTVPPFGMVFAEKTDGEDRFLLWRPYSEEGCIRLRDGDWMKCDIGKSTELSPGETVAREYEILPSTTENHPEFTVPPRPGRYRISDSVSHYEETGAPESELSFEMKFSLASG